jgi:hypothetical protein
LGRVRQEDHLSPGVPDQPGKHNKTLSQKKWRRGRKKERERRDGGRES